jgi:hypothetical protein
VSPLCCAGGVLLAMGIFFLILAARRKRE